MIRTGQSLLEVVVATGLLVGVSAMTLAAFASTGDQVSEATVRQGNLERCRRVADALVRELRDANAVAADLDPPAPFEASSLRFRAVIGLDPDSGAPALSPSRESGQFRRVALEEGTVVVETPEGTRVLASDVAGLELTLVAPGLLEVVVDAEGEDGQGERLRDRVRVLVAMENALP